MDRPRIKIELDISDWIIEIIGLAFLVLMIGFPFYYYNQLPETFPLHFNASGEPDGFSQKNMLWTLPAIGLVLYIGMSILNRYPHLFNYPKEITEENAPRQYRIATKLIRSLNMLIAVSLFYLVLGIIQTSMYKQDGLGAYFAPIFLATILVTIGIYMYQAIMKNG